MAIAAAYHKIPFYVAAPSSTFDLKIRDGSDIPIERRNREEVSMSGGVKKSVPDGAEVFNPAFDVTPAELITAIITEAGVIYPPYVTNIEGIIH